MPSNSLATGPRSRLKELNRRLNALKQLTGDESVMSMPEWVSFLTTAGCNLTCPHCITHGTPERHHESNNVTPRMPLDLLSDVARDALPVADEFTLALNGEPLATPHLSTALSKMTGFGAKLHLVTNGTTLTKKRLIELIPICGLIHLSIDGSTEQVFEAIRRRAKFKQVMNRTRVLTRAIELLPEGFDRPRVLIAHTVMASNLRELPELVRLARELGIKTVDAHAIVVSFDHVRNEDLVKHRGAYNAFAARAQEEALRLGVDLTLPPPFPGVDPDPEAVPSGPGLIVSEPLGQGAIPVHVRDVLDGPAIEEEAREIADAVVAEGKERARLDEGEASVRHLLTMAEAMLEEKLAEHHETLEALRAEPETRLPYCYYLHRCTYVDAGGNVVPCCTEGRPVLGNVVQEGGLHRVWNNASYQDFNARFRAGAPDPCCLGCPHARDIDVGTLLHILDG